MARSLTLVGALGYRNLRDHSVAFEVLERQPFEGPLVVRFDSGDHALGGALVVMMRVDVESTV